MSSRPTETLHLADRIRQVEEHARIHLAQRQLAVESVEPAVPEPATPAVPARLLPRPRKARMYVRHGPFGPGFADVTLTRPLRDTGGAGATD
jgi:hypothetical protein